MNKLFRFLFGFAFIWISLCRAPGNPNLLALNVKYPDQLPILIEIHHSEDTTEFSKKTVTAKIKQVLRRNGITPLDFNNETMHSRPYLVVRVKIIQAVSPIVCSVEFSFWRVAMYSGINPYEDVAMSWREGFSVVSFSGYESVWSNIDKLSDVFLDLYSRSNPNLKTAPFNAAE
jgi:hypothetical protein